MDNRFAYLAALAYSYLDPAQKILNKRVQASLKAMATKYGFIDLSNFAKAGAAGDVKKDKGTKLSSSNEVILTKDGKRNINNTDSAAPA